MLSICNSLAASRFRKLSLFIAFSLFSAASVISGQTAREQKPPLRERMFFGGSMGLQFGTITDIQVAPIVGIWLLPRLAVAAGPNYRYYKDPYFSTIMYGGNAYTQFVVVKDINNFLQMGVHTGIFLHLEDELLSLESAVWDPYNPSDRFAINTVLAGFGISQQLGARAALNLEFLWPLNNTSYGLYSSPEIRIAFAF